MRVITIDITFVCSNVHDTTFDPYGHSGRTEPIFPTSFLYDFSLVPRPFPLPDFVHLLYTKTGGGNSMGMRLLTDVLASHCQYMTQSILPSPSRWLAWYACTAQIIDSYMYIVCTLEMHSLNICSMSQLLLSSSVMLPMTSSCLNEYDVIANQWKHSLYSATRELGHPSVHRDIHKLC